MDTELSCAAESGLFFRARPVQLDANSPAGLDRTGSAAKTRPHAVAMLRSCAGDVSLRDRLLRKLGGHFLVRKPVLRFTDAHIRAGFGRVFWLSCRRHERTPC